MTNEFTHCFILKERLFSKHYFSIIFNLTLLIPAKLFHGKLHFRDIFSYFS